METWRFNIQTRKSFRVSLTSHSWLSSVLLIWRSTIVGSAAETSSGTNLSSYLAVSIFTAPSASRLSSSERLTRDRWATFYAQSTAAGSIWMTGIFEIWDLANLIAKLTSSFRSKTQLRRWKMLVGALSKGVAQLQTSIAKTTRADVSIASSIFVWTAVSTFIRLSDVQSTALTYWRNLNHKQTI